MSIHKLSTKQILHDNIKRKPPKGLSNLKLWTHNIRSMYNVGSIFRSADAFGISEIILSGYSPAPPRKEITKTAIGAEEFVNWQKLDSPEEVMSYLKSDGYEIAGLEQTNESIPLPDFDIANNKKLCIVLGNEVTGIDEELLPLINTFISIPQYGHKHSLNVSVAAGITLYAFLEKWWRK